MFFVAGYMCIRPLTRNAHDSDSKKCRCATDDVEDGEACVGSSSTREQEAENIHEWNHSPAIKQEHEQHIHQVIFLNKGFHTKRTEHHLNHSGGK